jgi:hypothetical protein
MASLTGIYHSAPPRTSAVWKGLGFLLVLTGLLVLGCHENGTTGPTVLGPWQVRGLWPRGTHPVASPVSDAVLFVQEEPPAGLYLLHGGTASLLADSSFGVRADYTWSQDGFYFAVSAAGAVGQGTTGIWQGTAAQPQSARKLWDRGSHPRYLPNSEGLICAGPEDVSGSEGIWQISLDGVQHIRLVFQGVEPEVSPDGMSIAYLVPAGITGRTLVVLNRETARRDTVAGRVWNYSWLGNSQTIIFDTETEPFGTGYMLSAVNVSTHEQKTFGLGTRPAGFSSGADFVFTGIANDQNDGLFVASVGDTATQATRLSDSGTEAAPANLNRIVAQDTTGLIEMVR